MDAMHTVLGPSIKMVLTQVGLFVSSVLLVLILIIIGWLFSKLVIKERGH